MLKFDIDDDDEEDDAVDNDIIVEIILEDEDVIGEMGENVDGGKGWAVDGDDGDEDWELEENTVGLTAFAKPTR